MNTLIRGAGRLAKALAALTALLALLAALPYGLIRLIGWPLPHTLPSPSGLGNALTSPPPTTLYIDVLACLLWLCWLILALSFTIELAYALRRIHAPRIPGLGPGQFLAAALIAAIGLGAAAARPATAATTASPLPTTSPAATAPAHPATAAPAASTASPTTRAPETVTVAPGDTLYGIAKTTLGNGKDWPRLYQENEGRPQPDGARMTDPDLILPGWRIQIEPEAPAPSTTTASRPNTAQSPAATDPAPDTESAPATPATPAPAPTSTNTAPAPSGPTHAAAQADSAPTADASRSAAPARHDAPSATRIDLADGGAIAGSLLLALLGALALVRRHRRRFTNPFWPIATATLVHDELPPALRPAPAAAHEPDQDGLDEFGASIAQAEPPTHPDGHRFEADTAPHTPAVAPVTLGDSVAGPDVNDDEEQPGPAPVLASGHSIAVAHTAASEVTLDRLPGGMGLIGPGALGLARAIAATALTDGAADNRLERPRLIIGRGDLALLLEEDPGHIEELCDGVAELDITQDLPAALALLEEHLAYRTRLLEDYDCTNLDELAEQHGDLEPHPPLILLGLARQSNDARLTATAAAAAGLRAHLVLLGSHPTSPTWNITGESAITGESDPRMPDGARAFDLPAAALRQSLALLAAAAGTGMRDQQSPQEPDPAGPLAIPLGLGEYADPAPEAAGPENQSLPQADSNDGDESSDTEHAVASITSAPAGAGLASPSSLPAPLSLAAPEHPAPSPEAPAVETAGPRSGQGTVSALLEAFDAAIVRVRVLGPLVIEDANGPITTGLRANSRRLAARLAVHHRRGQSGDELAALWPDLSGKELSETRKTAMAYLRGPLRKATGATSAQFVLDTAGRYCFDPQLVGVDLALFDQLRTFASRTTDPSERTAAAEAALQLCDGELLTGNDEPWIEAARAGVRRDALATAALLAQLAADNGELEAALGWWEKARVIDDNEEVYRQIMKTQAALGRRVEIIATRDLLIAKLEAIGEYLAPATEQLLGDLLRERPRAGTGTASHPHSTARERRLVGGARTS